MCSDGTPVENHSRRGDDDFNFEEKELFLYIYFHFVFVGCCCLLFEFSFFYFKKKNDLCAPDVFIFLNVICSFVSIDG